MQKTIVSSSLLASNDCMCPHGNRANALCSSKRQHLGRLQVLKHSKSFATSPWSLCQQTLSHDWHTWEKVGIPQMLVEYIKQRSNKMISLAVQKPGLLSPLVLPQPPLQSDRKLTRTTTYWNTIGNYGGFVVVVVCFCLVQQLKGWGYRLVVDCFPILYKALELNPAFLS